MSAIDTLRNIQKVKSAPNRYSLSPRAGSAAITEATDIAITGNDQALEDGISVKFNAVNGHADFDQCLDQLHLLAWTRV